MAKSLQLLGIFSILIGVIIKYPRLIIIGEITNIIELIRNNICCKNKLFLELTSKIEIISPIKVTIVAVKKLKITEFLKASKKNFFKK